MSAGRSAEPVAWLIEIEKAGTVAHAFRADRGTVWRSTLCGRGIRADRLVVADKFTECTFCLRVLETMDGRAA